MGCAASGATDEGRIPDMRCRENVSLLASGSQRHDSDLSSFLRAGGLAADSRPTVAHFQLRNQLFRADTKRCGVSARVSDFIPARRELLSGLIQGLVGALQRGAAVLAVCLPRTISEAGERAANHSVEFFTPAYRTRTRPDYESAVGDFFRWGLPLPALASVSWPPIFHELCERLGPASAHRHLDVRQWLEWLTRSGVLRASPAPAVRGVRLSRRPILERDQAILSSARSLDGI
jgi:hypothetical protein